MDEDQRQQGWLALNKKGRWPVMGLRGGTNPDERLTTFFSLSFHNRLRLDDDKCFDSFFLYPGCMDMAGGSTGLAPITPRQGLFKQFG